MLVSKLMSELEKSSFCPSSSNRYYYLCNVDLCVFLYLSCLWFFQSGSFCDVFILTIISLLAQPVLLGASGDEKSPSLVVTGDPAGSKPADTHLFQVFFESTLPCLFRPPPPLILLSSSATQQAYIAVWACLSICNRTMWPVIFLLLVVTMYRIYV